MKKLLSLFFAIAVCAQAENLDAGRTLLRTNRQEVVSISFTNNSGNAVKVGIFDATSHCTLVTNRVCLAVAPVGTAAAQETLVRVKPARALELFTISNGCHAVYFPPRKFYRGILITNSGPISIGISP